MAFTSFQSLSSQILAFVKNSYAAKYLKLSAVLLLIFALFPAHAVTNVSLLYGYNGSNDVPLLTTSSGQLLTDLNYSKAVGLSPASNNTYSLGSAALQWNNIYTGSLRSAGDFALFAGGSEKVTVNASGNVGVGIATPLQTLVVSGQTNITGSVILNGTTTIRGTLYNWPSVDGSANQVLTTNGTGGLSWATAGGGSSNMSARNITAGSFGAEVGAGNYSFPANLSVGVNLSVGGRITDKTGDVTPVGLVMLYGGAIAPAGWLMANGSEINRTTYPDLFNVLNLTYGNTTDSTFKLPDLRQRFVLGKADSGTGSTLGGTGGAIDHTHTGPSHTHTYSTMIAHTHSVDPPSTGSDSQGSHTHSVNPPATTSDSQGSHTHNVDPPSTSVSLNDPGHTHTEKRNANFGSGNLAGPGNFDETPGGGTSGSSTTGISGSSDVGSFTSSTDGAHTHTTDIGSTTSSSDGGHTHATDIASFTSGSTGSASGTSDAGGTGNTGTGNPPFLVLNYIIKY